MNDKVFIVTGGSGLLGKEIVDNLKSKRYIVYNFDIQFENDDDKNIKCDVTSEKDIINGLARVYKKHQRIDGLVNNAYPKTKDWGDSFLKMSMESWGKNLDMQLNGYVMVIQKCLPYLIKQKFGSIISIASIYGVVANDDSLYEGTSINSVAAYSAIKGGLISFNRFMAAKYGCYNIRFNCVSPGGVFDFQDKRFVERYEQRVPLKRMANPDDIAPVVSFILSEDSKYITGQNIIVDGGWTCI